MFSRVYSGSLNLFKLGRPSNLAGIQSRTFHYTCDPKSGHGKVFFCSDNSSDLSKDVTVIPSITKEQVIAHCTLRKDVLKKSLTSRTVLSNLMYYNEEKSEALVLGLKTRFKEWYPKWRKAHLTESDDVWFLKIAQKMSEILYPCFDLLKHSIKEDLGLFNLHPDILLDSLWINEQGENKGDGEFVVPYPLIRDSKNDQRKEARVIGNFVFAIVNRLPIEQFGEEFDEDHTNKIRNRIYSIKNVPRAVQGYLYFLSSEFDPKKHDFDVALGAPILLMSVEEVTQLIMNTYLYFSYASTGQLLVARTNILEEFKTIIENFGPQPTTPPAQHHPYYSNWVETNLPSNLRALGRVAGPNTKNVSVSDLLGVSGSSGTSGSSKTSYQFQSKYDIYYGTIKFSRDVITHFHEYQMKQQEIKAVQEGEIKKALLFNRALQAQSIIKAFQTQSINSVQVPTIHQVQIEAADPVHPDKVIILLDEYLNVVWLIHQVTMTFISTRTWGPDELEFFKTFVGYLPSDDDRNIWASENRFKNLKK